MEDASLLCGRCLEVHASKFANGLSAAMIDIYKGCYCSVGFYIDFNI